MLLAQATPSFEYRFLRNLLAREETIELHTVLQEADAEYAEEDPAALRVFPVRRDELFAYDVVILGDVNPALLSPTVWQNLADFVDQPASGGALVVVAGPRYMPQALRDTPLARLLPFDLGSLRDPDPHKPLTEGFVVRADRAGPGQSGDAIGRYARGVAGHLAEPAAAILDGRGGRSEAGGTGVGRASHPHRPRRQAPAGDRDAVRGCGQGAVPRHRRDLALAARWATTSYARYWIQMIRYLSRSKLAEGDRSARLSTDRREYRVGEPVRLQVRFTDERLAPAEDNGVTVVLEHPGHKTRRRAAPSVEAGRGAFEGLLASLPAGELSRLDRRAGAGRPGPCRRFRRGPAARRDGPRRRWKPPKCGRPPT